MNLPKVGVIVLLVLSTEAFNTFGQYSFKKTAGNLHKPRLSDPKSVWLFFRRVFVSPWVWLGLTVMTLGLIVWLMALSQGELSLVYPLGSLQYILVLFTARFFLKERVDKSRVVGTILVVLGIILITVS